jgi:4-diphosphocytidyl-2-C-methyl-D-erythritol kinase
MATSVRSFAKINIGLYIGQRRSDGFHELRTVYQTLALHDVIRVDAGRGTGIEIRCKDPRVPTHETNTCWRVAERVLHSLKQRRKVTITIEKQLPVQGGMGAASSNAVATMLALESELGTELDPDERLRIAAEVGSDLPLFLVGGTILGIGRGEQILPLQDLPPLDIVVVTPEVGVSTPEAFADWDAQFGRTGLGSDVAPVPSPAGPDFSAVPTSTPAENQGLTGDSPSSRMFKFSQTAYSWLAGSLPRFSGRGFPGQSAAGVPVSLDASSSGGDNGGRVETLLLDLVRAGIENDFERVVFPKHPELREVKRALEREGARYASLSGSGSTLYGLFESAEAAQNAARKLTKMGLSAVASQTLTRQQYWRQMFDF